MRCWESIEGVPHHRPQEPRMMRSAPTSGTVSTCKTDLETCRVLFVMTAFRQSSSQSAAALQQPELAKYAVWRSASTYVMLMPLMPCSTAMLKGCARFHRASRAAIAAWKAAGSPLRS